MVFDLVCPQRDSTDPGTFRKQHSGTAQSVSARGHLMAKHSTIARPGILQHCVRVHSCQQKGVNGPPICQN